MPTPDIPNVELANTFNDWRVVTNNLVDVANDLKSNDYTKEDGILAISSDGTALSITNDATIGGTLTVGNVAISGDFTVGGVPIEEVATGGANTVKVSQNSSSTLSQVSLNFVSTPTITASVTPGSSGNANVSFTYVGGAIEGVQGAQGFQGRQGSIGIQGYQGNQGFQGTGGSRGYQGYQGNQGFQGTGGSRGYQGYQGHQGTIGNTGVQGSIGVQGHQGTALGVGLLRLGSAYPVTTSPTTLPLNTIENVTSLKKGEFSTTGYRYTATSNVTLLVSVMVNYYNVDAGVILRTYLYKGDSEQIGYFESFSRSGTNDLLCTHSINRIVTLDAGEYVFVKVENDGSGSPYATLGAGRTYMNIVELY
jgi:hypothetical protein